MKQEEDKIFTFGPDYKDIANDIISSIRGGYSGVFHRRLLTSSTSDSFNLPDDQVKNAKFAKCGHPFKAITAYDVNALYAFAMMGPMPTGPGNVQFFILTKKIVQQKIEHKKRCFIKIARE